MEMSAFECNVTPTRVRNAKKRTEDREPTIVDLQPFSGKSIVTFEDVPVSKVARRIITVINPFSESLKVSIVKKPKAEFNLAFEWLANEIQANSKVDLELIWSPLKAVGTRETLEIVDQFGNKKSVAIILKSCELKKLAPRKAGLVTKPLRLKPPSPPNTFIRHVAKKIYTREEYAVENMEVESFGRSMSPVKQSTMIVTAVKSPLRNATNFQTYHEEEKTEVNITPRNASALFSNIKFTPLTETKPKGESKLEYLTSLPTPVTVKRDDIELSNRKTEIRALTTRGIDYSPEIDSLITPMVTTRQTVEVQELSETPRRATASKCTGMLMNRMAIQEEEVDEIEDVLASTYVKGPCEIDEIDIILTNDSVMGKTRVVAEENVYKFNKSKSFIESSVTDFDCQHKRAFSESMREENEGDKLKLAIQGSMPNLCDIKEDMPIEQNRYYLSVNTRHAQNTSIESVTSTSDFRELEFCAASSRFNINEVGRSPKTSSPVLSESPMRDFQPKNVKVESPVIKRVQVERLLTFSPPRNKLSDDVREVMRRETFTVKNKPPKSPYVFAIPKVPRDYNMRGSSTQISQSLTSLCSSMTSIASTSSVPATNGKLYNENIINSYSKKDPFSATTTEDPFLSSSMYLDERTLDGIEKSFMKWLNALVTIPADLESKRDEKIDVAKLFNDVQNKDLTLAVTKEIVCSQYYTSRLDSLRSAAVRFFHSEEISKTLNKLAVIISEKKLLEVHSARAIHLDLVLQRSLLELLLCFNPLWLRIGLEVVFNVQLNLHSNQDIFGMSKFIINNMFKSQYLQQKYSKYHQQEELLDKMRKHTAKHFLFVLFFLDRAKEQKLIKQNPCLFMKTAPYKDSNEILKKFASLVLANYGDIIRMMKRLNFVVTHKQTVIDEFDYAFKNLAIDLRDGVRLTKVMEVILLRDDLVKRVRVPAISRLQKVHNVELALKALEQADYKIMGKITAKDIADGHREKTLSLLWQIIYKFRSPRFNAAASIIQKFWRAKWLKIVIDRRIIIKEEEKQSNAAIVLQKHFRGWKSRRETKVYREKLEKSIIVFQKFTRGFLARKKLKKMESSAVCLQRWFRRVKEVRKIQQEYQHTRRSVIKIQSWWRRQMFAKKMIATAKFIREMKNEENQAAIKIQRYFKGYQQMKKDRKDYLNARHALIKLQQRYRGRLLMKSVQENYKLQKSSVIKIQNYWLGYQQMKRDRADFLAKRNAIIKVQKRFRGKLLMQKVRKEYQEVKIATIIIQQIWRAKLIMRVQRTEYQATVKKIVFIQQTFKAKLMMRKERDNFMKLKSSTIIIQRRFRAHQAMLKTRSEFLQLKQSVLNIESRYLALRQMKEQRDIFENTKTATIKIQRWYRNIKFGQKVQENYQLKKSSSIKIQKWWRNQLLARKITSVANVIVEMRAEKLKHQIEASVKIQKYYRGFIQMKKDRREFLAARTAIIKIQQRYRCKLQTQTVQATYKHTRNVITRMQLRWRATLAMREQRTAYKHTVEKIIFIQQRFRANQQMKAVRNDFLTQKNAVIKIQDYFKRYLVMKETRLQFIKIRTATVTIQKYFRGHLQMKKDRETFLKAKNSIVKIQRRFRGKLLMKADQHDYQVKRNAIIKIQKYRRSVLLMRQQKTEYQATVQRIIFIQRKFRATLAARSAQKDFNQLKSAAVVIQRRFRAHQIMLKTRNEFIKLKQTVLIIENRYLATKLANAEHAKFLEYRKAVIFVQRRFRLKLEARKLHKNFIQTRKSVYGLQAHARGYLARRYFFEHLQTPENLENRRRHKAARTIQAAWRGFKERSKKSNMCFRAIVQRLIKVSKNVDPTQTLAAKLKISMDFLRNRYDSSVAIATLIKLEYMSRTVPWILTDDAEFISAFCYSLMAQAIRSEVDKQIIELCSCIILNLGRYSGTKEDAFQESGLNTVANMLLRWCDKDCGIFNTLCTLIWVFSQCKNKKKVIRKFMMMRDGEFIMSQIKQNVARKENMRRNSRRPIGYQSISLIKYKKDYQLQLSHQPQTVYSSGYITPEMMKQCRQLPTFEPDYGVVRMHPYIFYSSVFAFETILKSLDITIIK